MPWHRLAIACFVVLAIPMVSAGSREDPEVVDAANDATRYPGVPTVEPTVDILAIWFTEPGDELQVNLEVAQIGASTPNVPNVNSGESYAVHVFVDGEDEGDGRCSGWGDFGVRWHLGQPTGTLQYGWHYDGEACPAEDKPIAVAVADNVITWSVPKADLAMLWARSELAVARAEAWSGDTWPTTPGDRADNLPGRPFVVDSVPSTGPPANGTGIATETAQDAPGMAWIVAAVALVVVAVRRRD